MQTENLAEAANDCRKAVVLNNADPQFKLGMMLPYRDGGSCKGTAILPD
jgi:hypothetical protein